MQPEFLRIPDYRHIADRLNHAKNIMEIPDLTSYCSATAFTAVFGPEAYVPSRLVIDQSLTATEEAINEAANLTHTELYRPDNTHSFMGLLHHLYAQGALFLSEIPVAQHQPIAHVFAVVPSDIRTADQEEPAHYYAVDTKTSPYRFQISLEGVLDMYANAQACFVVTRSIIPQRLEEA